MTARFFASSALGLALFLCPAPSSAVSLDVTWETDTDLGYSLRLLVTQDGGPDATFSSCADQNCIWDVDVTFSEAGGGIINWSGSGTHGSADTYLFSGTNGTVFDDIVMHGANIDFYGGGYSDLGSPPGGPSLPVGEFVLGTRHVPEPAAALLLASAVISFRNWGTRFQKR